MDHAVTLCFRSPKSSWIPPGPAAKIDTFRYMWLDVLSSGRGSWVSYGRANREWLILAREGLVQACVANAPYLLRQLAIQSTPLKRLFRERRKRTFSLMIDHPSCAKRRGSLVAPEPRRVTSGRPAVGSLLPHGNAPLGRNRPFTRPSSMSSLQRTRAGGGLRARRAARSWIARHHHRTEGSSTHS